jgi:hypothetical protein
MERDAHESCSAYYASARLLSVRNPARRTTAAMEIRYWPRGGYSTFVLNRQTEGGQAVRSCRVASCRSPDATPAGSSRSARSAADARCGVTPLRASNHH